MGLQRLDWDRMRIAVEDGGRVSEMSWLTDGQGMAKVDLIRTQHKSSNPSPARARSAFNGFGE